MSWGDIRLSSDHYQDEMQRLEKKHARRAKQGRPAQSNTPRGTGYRAAAWINRLAAKFHAVEQHERQDVSTASTDLI